MEKQGSGIRDWALGITVGLGFLAMFSVTASTAPGGDSIGENLRITVRVHDFAQIPAETLSHAEMVATSVFKEVGVELAWLDCNPLVAEIAQNPDCHGPSPTMLRLRILPQVTSGPRALLRKEALGFAVTVPRPDHGYLVSVYYDRVSERAEKLGYHDWQILGFAIAHEIGHLLLGSNSHSRSGLMRGKWDKDSMAWGVRGVLPLSREESAAIRTGVEARVAESQRSQDLLLAGAKTPNK